MAKQEKTAAELYREERKARIAKAAKKNQKKSHKIILTKGAKTLIAVLVVIAIAGGIAGFAVSNSGVLERGKKAFNVGETEVTMPEYGYYYNSIFSYYFNMAMQYDSYSPGMGLAYVGYDYTKMPAEQSYSGEIEGIEDPTFADFFEETAKNNIKYIKGCLIYAAKNNITLDEEDLKSVDESMSSITETAKNNNFSTAAYLRMCYGKGMTEKLVRQILEEQALASKVQTVKTEEYGNSYTAAEIEKEFNDKITTYGVVSLRNYSIDAESTTTTDDEGNESEVVSDAAMAKAKAEAESFAAKVSDDASFKNAAAEAEKAAKNEDYKDYITDDSKTLIEDATYDSAAGNVDDEDFQKWVSDKNTAVGSTYILETEGTGYTVYMMSAPMHKAADTITYDVRHILIKFPDDDSTSSDTADDAEETTDAADTTEAADEAKEEVDVQMLDTSKYEGTNIHIDVDLENTGDKALYKQAQDILVQYLEGDKTEDSFAALAVANSADSNAEDGGIYEDVAVGDMVAEFENWALADGRVKGDVGIVETQFGYHIMYFIAKNTTTWEETIRNDLGTEKYDDLATKIQESKSVEITDVVDASIANVNEFVEKLAKQQIRNSQQSSSSY